MKAIIIEEARFAELTDILKGAHLSALIDSNTPERLGWDQQIWEAAVREAHSRYHCEFVRWAQSHGASCVR